MRCIKSFRVDIPINEYIRRCEKQIVDWEDQEKELLNNSQLEHTKSVEYASRIILGMVTGSKDLIYGNVLNQNFIPNLPHNSCVEVPCIVQKNEIIPQTVTPLPMHLANLIQTNINVQQLTVEALKTQKKETIYQGQLPVNSGSKVNPDPFLEAGLDMLNNAYAMAQFYDRDAPAEMASEGMKGFQEYMVNPDRRNIESP